MPHVEIETAKVGLQLNEKKTKLSFNQETSVNVITQSDKSIEVIKNFKYLGSWMESTEKDFNVWKALAWSSCHKLKMSGILHSSVLLYGNETLTLAKSLEK